ncbi:AAA family ATPase [Bacteroides sp. UBA939]|uniref:AAA family ATPase n=1 Tax=Bacteroides sp. UBA939 TaxID=1946092 RepID=UPI0025BDF1EC|nr:ATP-binding protein [Bacteroides sp. UBA939]
MIAEIGFKNLFSFRDEAIFSFEADNSKELESYHVVNLAPGVRLLKLAVVYGANASGKSNFIKVCDFIKKFVVRTPINKGEETGIIPFLMNKNSSNESSDLSVSFYIIRRDETPLKFMYKLSLTKAYIVREELCYYPGQQPAMVFDRTLVGGVSSIKFGNKLKLTAAAKEEISLKCLPNMSVLAAYTQVNVNIPEIEEVLAYFRSCMMQAVTPALPLSKYAEVRIKEEQTKDYILQYLQEADFNISDISAKDRKTSAGVIQDTIFQHKVQENKGVDSFYEFPELLESRGTLRTMGLAGCIQETIANNAFLAIDEIESSLHPRLIEYIIERFLKESENAQLLLTTHYDGLLAEEDLIRKDNVWFTEKSSDGSTILYPLTDFKGLNRISSLQKAYKFGKFGAIPNI